MGFNGSSGVYQFTKMVPLFVLTRTIGPDRVRMMLLSSAVPIGEF